MSLEREYKALTNLPAPSDLSVNDVLDEGLPIAVVSSMTRMLHVDKNMVAKMINVSPRRINQLSSGKAFKVGNVSDKLNKAASEKALLVTRLFLNLCDYFGDEEKAQQWFNTPNRTLGNQSPSALCSNYFGIEQVNNTLNKLKHGFTA